MLNKKSSTTVKSITVKYSTCKHQLDRAINIIRGQYLADRDIVVTVIYRDVKTSDKRITFPIVVKEFFNDSSKDSYAVHDVHKFLLTYYRDRGNIFSILLNGVSIYTQSILLPSIDDKDDIPF